MMIELDNFITHTEIPTICILLMVMDGSSYLIAKPFWKQPHSAIKVAG